MFLRYDPDFNTISVLQAELGPNYDYVGTYKIDVIGTYDKPNGEQITIKKHFYLELLPNAEQVIDFEPPTEEDEKD